MKQWRHAVVLTMALGLLAAIAAPAVAQFGLVNRDKIRIGATWGNGTFFEDVQLVTSLNCGTAEPGNNYQGEIYLYNDPCKVYTVFGEKQSGPGYARGVLPDDWKLIALPPIPPGLPQPPPKPYGNNYLGWNAFDWPIDARYQYAIQLGLEGKWPPGHFIPGDIATILRVYGVGYKAPAGSKCLPLFAHIRFCRNLP